MYSIMIVVVYYMSLTTLHKMHKDARRKCNKDNKLTAVTAYGIILLTALALTLLRIGGTSW